MMHTRDECLGDYGIYLICVAFSFEEETRLIEYMSSKYTREVCYKVGLAEKSRVSSRD